MAEKRAIDAPSHAAPRHSAMGALHRGIGAALLSIGIAFAMAGGGHAQTLFGQPLSPEPQGSPSQAPPPPVMGREGGPPSEAPPPQASPLLPAPPPAVRPNLPPVVTQPQPPPQPAQQFARVAAYERQNFGVPPQQVLHSGAMHGPTPTSVPGGKVISTEELYRMLLNRQPMLLVDVLGGDTVIPGSVSEPVLGRGGGYNDDVQQYLATALPQVTGGRIDVPIIYYCAGIQCWMSYNAALRTIALGQTNVGWYRGGIEAWVGAGLQTVPRM